jgi:hypothetical protein
MLRYHQQSFRAAGLPNRRSKSRRRRITNNAWHCHILAALCRRIAARCWTVTMRTTLANFLPRKPLQMRCIVTAAWFIRRSCRSVFTACQALAALWIRKAARGSKRVRLYQFLVRCPRNTACSAVSPGMTTFTCNRLARSLAATRFARYALIAHCNFSVCPQYFATICAYRRPSIPRNTRWMAVVAELYSARVCAYPCLDACPLKIRCASMASCVRAARYSLAYYSKKR